MERIEMDINVAKSLLKEINMCETMISSILMSGDFELYKFHLIEQTKRINILVSLQKKINNELENVSEEVKDEIKTLNKEIDLLLKNSNGVPQQ